MVEIPDSLVERLKARQVVLVAGLGCSELAGAPGWKSVVDPFAQTACRLLALSLGGPYALGRRPASRRN